LNAIYTTTSANGVLVLILVLGKKPWTAYRERAGLTNIGLLPLVILGESATIYTVPGGVYGELRTR
jgi:hypothetical protein